MKQCVSFFRDTHVYIGFAFVEGSSLNNFGEFMSDFKKTAISLLFFIAQCASSAYAAEEKKFSEVTGPLWVTDTQVVIACTHNEEKEKCLTTKVEKNFGEIKGILQLKPLRNATASWIAVTNQTLVVCGVKVPTKQSACVEVDGFRSGLPIAYPKTTDDLVKLADRFTKSKDAFSAAGKQVSDILAAPIKDSKGEPVYTLSEDEGPDCTVDCPDEDMPVIIIIGDSGGGGGGGGGPRPNPDIDPNTGLPYPQVFVYPAPPVWPKDLSWCSLVGLFCATYEMPAPSQEWCYQKQQECYRQATDLYVNNREALPGSGPDYASRYRIFMRECLARVGCQDY